MSTLKGKSWADLSDSDSEVEEKNKDENFNITYTYNNLSELIINSNKEDFKQKIYTLVNARIKNNSHLGLNKMDKNELKDFENIKIEFYYTKRKLRVYKFYTKIQINNFEVSYKQLINSITNKDSMSFTYLNKFLQNCFVDKEILYIPFIKVDNKYYDLIKHFSATKMYEVVLYPIQL